MLRRTRKPTTTRQRSSGSRIQNLPIQSKIFSLVSVPLIALVVVGLVAIGSSALNASRGATVEQVADVAPALSTLVDELQEERRLAAEYVGGGRAQGLDALRGQYAVVDERVRVLDERIAGLEGAIGGGYEQVRDGVAVSDLDTLASSRQRVERGRDVTPEVAADLYTLVIRDLIDISSGLGSGVDSERLLEAASAATAVARVKDAAAQEQAIVGATISARRIVPRQAERLVVLAENQDFWAAQFRAAANPGQEALLDNALTGTAVNEATKLRDLAINSPGGRIGIDLAAWTAASDEQLDRLAQVEGQIAEDVAAAGAAVATAAQRQVVIFSLGLAAVLAVSVASSLLIGRSMSRPIKRLSSTAKRVAHERIPGVVQRMERAEEVDLAQEVQPSGITTKDEIGELAGAFDTLHQVAVRIAAEQSALRRSVSDMILNLARRSQTLTDRLLERITDLERDEADPGTLDKLFQLDHLATRMRRTAENMVVFSGNEPPRRWSEPVALPDIVEAAVAEAEDYTRVQLLGLDDIELQGRAANDVTHLLAELIDNATSFSPPNAAVSIAGQFVGRGYLIEIEDRGIGMAPVDLEETNKRLADPPTFDFAVRQRLGLFVVARLAQRYGMKVQLRHSVSSGVTALVMIPVELLTAYPEEVTARSTGSPALPGADPSGPRPPLTPAGAASQQQFSGGAASQQQFSRGAASQHFPLGATAVVPAAVAPTTGSLPVWDEVRSDWAAGGTARLTAYPELDRNGPLSGYQDSLQNGLPNGFQDGLQDGPRSGGRGGRGGLGLPRRTPNRAGRDGGTPAIPFGESERGAAPGQPTRRPPEQIRDMLSSFRTGIAQGRDEWGQSGQADPEAGEPETFAPRQPEPPTQIWEPRPWEPPRNPWDRDAGQ